MGIRASVLALVHRRRPQSEPWARAPRVAITPLHDVWFIRREPPPAGIERIANVSTSGIALMRAGGTPWPPPGERINGVLVVGRAAHPTELTVVHLTGDVVGCAFDATSPELSRATEEHLRLELAALTIVHVPPGELPTQVDGAPHWFHAHDGSYLYLIEHDGRVVRFSLAFHGTYLEGGDTRPVRFGLLTRDGALDAGPDAVQWLDMIDADELAVTIRFVLAIPSLPPSYRDDILRQLC